MRLVCRIRPSCGSNYLRGLRAAWGFYSTSPPAPPSRVPAGTGLAKQGRYDQRPTREQGRTMRSNSVNPGTHSPNATALRTPSLRAWREPGGGYSVPVRLARIMKRALDFHSEAQLPKSFFQESQPFTELASGSRICRHGRSCIRCRPVHEEKPTWR